MSQKQGGGLELVEDEDEGVFWRSCPTVEVHADERFNVGGGVHEREEGKVSLLL